MPLIRHEVEDRNREWFIRCKVNQTLAFPFVSYVLGRTALIAAVAWLYLPFMLVAAIVAAGLICAGLHALAKRRYRLTDGTDPISIGKLRALLTLSAVVWAATLIVCIAFAPEDLDEAPIIIGMITIMVEAIGLLALPVLALALATLEMAAISTGLILLGTKENLVAAVVAPVALIWVHACIFNMHYMFATRRLRTRELAEKNETVQLLLDHYHEEGSDWLFETDSEGRFLRPSERFCQAAGMPSWELTGKRFSEIMEHSPERNDYLARIARGEPIRDLPVPVQAAGERRWWSINLRPFRRENDECGWRGFAADITKTREAEERIAYMAHYDALTGLPNRNLFTTTLSLALSRRQEGAQVTVIQVELDHFKAINDLHGRAVGDRVLAEAGNRINEVMPVDTMVARLGGDEFAIVIEKVRDAEFPMRVAKAAVGALRQPLKIDGQQFPLGAHAGVACGTEDGETVDQLLRAADLALQAAKQDSRRGVARYSSDMHRQSEELRSLELDLRDALMRGELRVMYQPLLDARTGVTAGYEALLRWSHPTRGMISPATFIPIAEESGQIIPIGAWVMREALMEAAKWPKDIFVSINLSPIQLKDPRLINTIFMALSASGVEASRLEFEITESVLLHDSEENLAQLHKIHEMGVKISLDDFGTGYSSLNYLRSFPFDKIKIDRCFVTDLAEHEDSQAIMRSVIGLADELGMRTLAEGVETKEQLRMLRALGVNQLQGFLFSRALPGDELIHRRPKAASERPAASVTPLRAEAPVAAAARHQTLPGQHRAAG